MSAVLSSADLVVSRAGAGSIAEITRCNAPSILIPYPYSSDGHQILNARKHESMGGCIVLDENRIDRLYDEIKKIIHNDFILDKFKSNLKTMDIFNSKLEIVNDLESNFI